MTLEIDLDLTDLDPNKIEVGNSLEPGWYRAVVDDVYEDHKNPGNVVFVFRITDGDYEGAKTFVHLYDPAGAEDAEKAKKHRERRALFCKRLGVIQVGDFGQYQRPDVTKAIGVECVLKMVRGRIKDEATGKWVNKEKAEVDWAGVFPPTHEKVPPDLRQQGTAAAESAAPAGAGVTSTLATGDPPGGRVHSPTAASAAVRTAVNYDDL